MIPPVFPLPLQTTCRACSAPMRFDPDDPCPGLCAACFEREMARVARLLQGLIGTEAPPEHIATWLAAALLRVGLTPAAIRDAAAEYLTELGALN